MSLMDLAQDFLPFHSRDENGFPTWDDVVLYCHDVMLVPVILQVMGNILGVLWPAGNDGLSKGAYVK